MPVASASVEPGAELQPSPPRTGGRMPSHSLDRSPPLVEKLDATEADADLMVIVQLKQTVAYRPVSAAPTTRVRRLDEVASDRSDRHEEIL